VDFGGGTRSCGDPGSQSGVAASGSRDDTIEFDNHSGQLLRQFSLAMPGLAAGNPTARVWAGRGRSRRHGHECCATSSFTVDDLGRSKGDHRRELGYAVPERDEIHLGEVRSPRAKASSYSARPTRRPSRPRRSSLATSWAQARQRQRWSPSRGSLRPIQSRSVRFPANWSQGQGDDRQPEPRPIRATEAALGCVSGGRRRPRVVLPEQWRVQRPLHRRHLAAITSSKPRALKSSAPE